MASPVPARKTRPSFVPHLLPQPPLTGHTGVLLSQLRVPCLPTEAASQTVKYLRGRTECSVEQCWAGGLAAVTDAGTQETPPDPFPVRQPAGAPGSQSWEEKRGGFLLHLLSVFNYPFVCSVSYYLSVSISVPLCLPVPVSGSQNPTTLQTLNLESVK